MKWDQHFIYIKSMFNYTQHFSFSPYVNHFGFIFFQGEIASPLYKEHCLRGLFGTAFMLRVHKTPGGIICVPINWKWLEMKYYDMSGKHAEMLSCGCIYLLKDNKYKISDCCTLTALSSVGHTENTGIFSDRCYFSFDSLECTQWKILHSKCLNILSSSYLILYLGADLK